MFDTFFQPPGSISGGGGGGLPFIQNPASSPQLITAAGGISLTPGSPVIAVWIQGFNTAITVTAAPSLGAILPAGTIIYIFGTDNVHSATLQSQTDLASSGLIINGPIVFDALQAMALMSDGTNYREIGRLK